MDASGAAGELRELVEAFLDAIFAELELVGVECCADRGDRLGFGDGDQRDFTGVAASAIAGGRDVGPHAAEAFGDGGVERGHELTTPSPRSYLVGRASRSSGISVASGT